RGVAQARRVVDVVLAEEPRRLLRGVVDLVRDAAGRQIDGEALRIDAAQLAGDAIERLVPRDDPEAAPVALTQERFRQAAERPQLPRCLRREGRDVGEE